jgi:hypothetical protein
MNPVLWKITMFNGKIHYKWPCSIAMLNYHRVTHVKANVANHTTIPNEYWDLSYLRTDPVPDSTESSVETASLYSDPSVREFASQRCFSRSRDGSWFLDGSKMLKGYPGPYRK